MAKQFDPKYDFPERIYFTNAKNVKDFVDVVSKILENYGRITLIDLFDTLSAFESDTYGTIIEEFKSMNGIARLCNYGWRVCPFKSHQYTPFKTDSHKWALNIISPIFLEKENEMTYKDINTRSKVNYKKYSECSKYMQNDIDITNLKWNTEYVRLEDIYSKRYFKPEKILKNGPATIFFWKNGKKTVVKATDGEEMDLYNAFCIAAMKRIFSTNSSIKSCLRHTLIEGDWK